MTTAAIAGFACREHEPSRHTAAVATALLDTFGVAIAGRRTDAVRIVTDWIAGLPSTGDAPVWGTGLRVSPMDAALINGTAAHALDWDDASPSMPMHPSAVLIPALLAHAAQSDVSGAAIARAYSVGAAVFRAVSEALPVNDSVGRGWHNTATTGRLAAVAALANLSSLDRDSTAHALGLAASLAGGSTGNFGTMTKPLHAGLAARDGLMAVSIAARGFTANPGQLEDPHGFFAMFGNVDPEALAAIPARLDYWQENWPADWSIKRYPCCYATHHAADAARDIRGPFHIDDVAQVDVSIYAPDLSFLTACPPKTGLEAKFSLEYVVAVALIRGGVTLADFEPEAITAPEVAALMAKVQVVGDSAATQRFADLRVTLHDGRRLAARTDVGHGGMTPQAVRAKFLDACRSAGWSPEVTDRVAHELLAVTERSTSAGLDEILAAPASFV